MPTPSCPCAVPSRPTESSGPRQSRTATNPWGAHHKLVARIVTVHASFVAADAQVKVWALPAAQPCPRLDLVVATIAGGGEGGGLRVVQVVQHHHAAVLGAPQRVELVVVALAQGQEGLRRGWPVSLGALHHTAWGGLAGDGVMCGVEER